MRDLKDSVWYSIIALVVIAIFAIGITALQGGLYPWWLSIQRRAVEQSKSFTDANNNMLETYMLEYSRLDTKIVEVEENKELIVAYEAQQKAIVGKMCRQVSTMVRDTVNPNTRTWLNSKGGCQ